MNVTGVQTCALPILVSFQKPAHLVLLLIDVGGSLRRPRNRFDAPPPERQQEEEPCACQQKCLPRRANIPAAFFRFSEEMSEQNGGRQPQYNRKGHITRLPAPHVKNDQI